MQKRVNPVDNLEVLQEKIDLLKKLVSQDERNLERFGISETIELEVRDKHTGRLKERRMIKT